MTIDRLLSNLAALAESRVVDSSFAEAARVARICLASIVHEHCLGLNCSDELLIKHIHRNED